MEKIKIILTTLFGIGILYEIIYGFFALNQNFSFIYWLLAIILPPIVLTYLIYKVWHADKIELIKYFKLGLFLIFVIALGSFVFLTILGYQDNNGDIKIIFYMLPFIVIPIIGFFGIYKTKKKNFMNKFLVIPLFSLSSLGIAGLLINTDLTYYFNYFIGEIISLSFGIIISFYVIKGYKKIIGEL